MSTTDARWGPGANAEAIQAWDGPLFDRWLRFRHVVTTGLGAHGDVALSLVPPQQGQRVLDIGCGLGDTTQQIAALVGPDGEAVGVDAAERFIETATAEAAEASVLRTISTSASWRMPRKRGTSTTRTITKSTTAAPC